MEHRLSPRHNCHRNAIAWSETAGFLPGTITNVSLDGIYFETDTVDLRINASLLIFFLDGNHIQRCKGQIVHRNERGVGIMLMEIPQIAATLKPHDLSTAAPEQEVTAA